MTRTACSSTCGLQLGSGHQREVRVGAPGDHDSLSWAERPARAPTDVVGPADDEAPERLRLNPVLGLVAELGSLGDPSGGPQPAGIRRAGFVRRQRRRAAAVARLGAGVIGLGRARFPGVEPWDGGRSADVE